MTGPEAGLEAGLEPGAGLSLLLDTHAWAWAINEDDNLSSVARRVIVAAPARWVSAASIYEVAQKVRLGKWPEMARHAGHLPTVLGDQGLGLLDVTAEVALLAGRMPWPHRDPFDRLIAATAQIMGLALVSTDATFDSVPGGLTRVW